MDIYIDTFQHPHQWALKSFYKDKLNKMFSNLEFVDSLKMSVSRSLDGFYEISIAGETDKSNFAYATARCTSEYCALLEATRKIKAQLKKYRIRRYYSLYCERRNFREKVA